MGRRRPGRTRPPTTWERTTATQSGGMLIRCVHCFSGFFFLWLSLSLKLLCSRLFIFPFFLTLLCVSSLCFVPFSYRYRECSSLDPFYLFFLSFLCFHYLLHPPVADVFFPLISNGLSSFRPWIRIRLRFLKITN